MKVTKALRRPIALLVMCSLAFACFALSACGQSKPQASSSSSSSKVAEKVQFDGCWKLLSIEQDGKTISSSEVKEAYQSTGFMYLLKLNADGSGSFDAYTSEKVHEDITWEETGADKATVKFEDGIGLAQMSGSQLKLEEGGMVFFFSKASQSDYDTLLNNLGSKPKGSSASSGSSSASTSASGVNPDFKKQMDDYEAFFDEYVAFMKQYMANPSDTTLLSKMSSMMSKYSSMIKNFENIKNQSLSAADAAYYSEVSARIVKKLADVV